jgi:hypothetical protein
MTRNNFLSLVGNPGEIGAAESQELALLSRKYPWCQPVQILYAKGLHNTKSIEYLEQLKYTSAITSDRKVLYSYIMQQALREKIESLIEEIREEEVPDVRQPEINPEETEVEKDNSVIEDNRIEDIIEKTVEATLERLKQKEKQEESVESRNIDPDSLSNPLTIDDLISLEEESFEEEDKITETVAEENLVTEDKKEPEPVIKPAPLPYDEFEKQILWEAVNASIHTDVIEDLVKESKPETITESTDGERKSFFRWLVTGEMKDADRREPDSESEENSRKKSDELNELVDKFLQKDPKITPLKAEFYTPGNVAKLSITDNEEFVSETLAGIYEKQGYFGKAIRVYEKLSLKIPEKSTYFASRIKELELLHKNSKK